jgi:hypothetical protein
MNWHDRDVTRILSVTDADAGHLPECCGTCVFWQRTGASSNASAKRRWSRRAERSFGPWGRVLQEGGEFRGVIQYGPRSLFPRSRIMPSGPASPDAAVVTCVYLGATDRADACERLFLEALADLQARGIGAVEAFSINYPDEVPTRERFEAHHTMFDREFLEHLGFSPVRVAGQVALMRLALTEPVVAPTGRVAAMLARVRGIRAPEVAPAA